MERAVDETPVENRSHLVHTVAEQKAAVENRHVSIGLGEELAVDIDDAAHELLHLCGASAGAQW